MAGSVRSRVCVAVAHLAAAGLVAIGFSAPNRHAAAASATWAIIGDSVVAGNSLIIEPQLAAAHMPPWFVEAKSGRRTEVPVVNSWYQATSGLQAVARTLALGHHPALWVIELGTNDAYAVQWCECPDRVAFAGEMIDHLLQALGPGAQVVWLTIRNSLEPIGADAFNTALAQRAGPSFMVADWRAYSDPHPEWFVDGTHPTTPGAIALGNYLAAIATAALAGTPIANPPLMGPFAPCPTPPSSTTPPTIASTLGTSAAALQQARRCAVASSG